jgi:hypothetical protein
MLASLSATLRRRVRAGPGGAANKDLFFDRKTLDNPDWDPTTEVFVPRERYGK